MSSVTAVQIHCPFCNGAQAAQATGDYVCDFCLQPFSVVQARNEESRILDEIKGWLEKKVGGAGLAPASVDASSRAYIFGQKILPDLRREVDRALESLGTYGQTALVPLPIPTPRPAASVPNPLVHARQEILSLKNLRARLASDQVSAFAIGENDKASIQAMDRRLAEVVFLSNVADAATRRDPAGYATARRNLVSLLEEVGQSLALEGVSDGNLARFLDGLKGRYTALADLCSICETLSSPNELAGEPVADRLDVVERALQAAAQTVESSDYSPADSMPIVVGIRHEAASTAMLARWLRAYDVLARKAALPFYGFVAQVNALYDDSRYDAASKADLLEGCAFVVRAVRGELHVPFHDDFGWVSGWIEASRAKKSFGMFGAEERVVASEEFLLPVWMAEVSFSRSAGKVFKEGVEGRCVAFVDACAPAAASVHFLADGGDPLAAVLTSKRRLGSTAIALPASTVASARAAIEGAARSRPDLQNPRVEVRGLAFVPAAWAALESKNGTRYLAGCIGGKVPVGPSAKTQAAAARQALSVFA